MVGLPTGDYWGLAYHSPKKVGFSLISLVYWLHPVGKENSIHKDYLMK